MSGPAPRRRVVLTLEIGADSWRDLEGALNTIDQRLRERERDGESAVHVTSGGYSFGFHLEADEDPSVDHDSYFAANEAWLESTVEVDL